MKRILLGVLLIGAISASVFGLSQAFFSDTETSVDNTLAAGRIDLKIDNESYYNGDPSEETSWLPDDLPGHLFFNFTDIKPGDFGEDTISLRVDDNDAWACMSLELTEDDDETCTEPELIDDPKCNQTDSEFDGELGVQLNFVWWADDGDNVLEEDERNGAFVRRGNAKQLFNGEIITLADSTKTIWGNTAVPMTGGQTYYIGKAWCFGELTLAPLAQDGFGVDSPTTPDNSTGGIACDGSGLNNAAQSDILMADVEFTAYQARHNDTFTCNGTTPTPTTTVTITPTPTPLACGQADVMLVLDRSGSISSPELSSLKTAANEFVSALGLTPTGVHAGMSSFATTALLNHHLDSNTATLQAAINALAANGFTNLSAGINTATTELANPGDSHDRADISSPDKMIIITDGHPNRPLPEQTADDLAETAANNARAAGIEIFVVGVGSDVDTDYLQNEIADPGNYYTASDYSGLQTVLENLDLCDE